MVPDLPTRPGPLLMFVVCCLLLMLPTSSSCSGTRPPLKVEAYADWASYPVGVYIEPGAPVTREEVSTAIAFWEGMGYELELRSTWPNPQVPATLPAIVFRLGLMDDPTTHAAVTHTYHYGGIVTHADVFVKPYFEKDWDGGYPPPKDLRTRVVAHELGHALGFEHVERPGHVMYPIAALMDWDSEGLHRRLRREVE